MLLRRVPCALVTRLQCQRTLSTSAIAEDSPVELAYKRFDVEKAINPPVVLIHGLLGSKDSWNYLGPRFAEALRSPVYAIDLRNHGESPHVKQTDVLSMANDVLFFCKQKNLKEILLYGYDFGARIAAAVTLRPDLPRGLVHKLIYEDTTLDLYRPVTKEWLQMVDAIRLASGLGLSTRELMDAALSKSIGDPYIRAFILENLVSDSGHDGETTRWRIPEWIYSKSTLGDIVTFPFTTDAPVSFMGEALFIKNCREKKLKSTAFPLGQRESIRTFFPNSKIIIPYTGHWAQLAVPPKAAVQEAVRNRLLKKVTSFMNGDLKGLRP